MESCRYAHISYGRNRGRGITLKEKYMVLVNLTKHQKQAIQFIGTMYILIVGLFITYQTLNLGTGMMFFTGALIWGTVFSESDETLDDILRKSFNKVRTESAIG